MPVETPPDLQMGPGGLPSLHGGMLLAHQSAPPQHQIALLSEGSRQRDRGTVDSSWAREEDLRRQYFGSDGGGGRWNGDWQGFGLPGTSGGLSELGPVRDARGGLLHEARDQRQPESRAGFAGPLGRREPHSYHGH